MSLRIDLNSDVGELPSLIADGTEETIMRHVTSVNVACGAHAGDEATILHTLRSAKALELAVGAHPSYPDRAQFGRVKLEMPASEISQTVAQQIEYVARLAEIVGVEITHVKPHGALYNAAAESRAIAEAVCDGIAQFSRSILVVGLASSLLVAVARERGFAVASEAFIDRRYERDGRLRARSLEGALLTNADEAVRQALSIVKEGRVRTFEGSWLPVHADTLCIHGDTPGAPDLARLVSSMLAQEGIRIERIS